MAGLRADQWLTLGVILVIVVLAGAALPQTEVLRSLSSAGKPDTQTIRLLQLSAMPVRRSETPAGAASVPQVSAQAVMVQDAATGAVLFEKASDQPRSPASTTKLMTALVAKQIFPLDQIVTIKEEAFSQGTVIKLTVGEQLTVHNLLYGLLMSSGNDTAFALANYHALGYNGFVTAMNQAAKQWHLEDTYFTNPSGLDQPRHLTTARDLALLARVVSQDQVLRPIISTKLKTITDVTGEQQHPLRSTHQLLGVNSAIVGGKTGTTELAGEVLVNVATIKGHEVIIVVMGSQNRYTDTVEIINWLDQQYQWLEPS